MPKQIQEPTTFLKIQSRYGLVGAITPMVDEVIVPVVLVDDLSEAEEWKHAFLSDQRGAGGAGTRNTWQLANPANSGKVLQLLQVSVFFTTAQTWRASVPTAQADLATLLSAIFQDLSGVFIPPNQFPTGQVLFEALGAQLGVTIVHTGRSAGNTHDVWRPSNTLLYPGQNIFFQMETTNQSGNANIEFRERILRADGT